MIDVIDRLPHLGSKGDYLKQQLKDKLIEHKHYVNEHGKDLPEILNWKWNAQISKKVELNEYMKRRRFLGVAGGTIVLGGFSYYLLE